MSLPADPAVLRPAVFFGLLLVLLVLEAWFPRRHGAMRRAQRWGPNAALAALGTALTAVVPLALAGLAWRAQHAGWGLFNLVALPAWLELLLAWLLLDLAIYLQHRALHRLPWLWPLHRVHHSDIEFDATTGLRFHPGEILLSLAWKMLLVAALGAAPLAVLLFELGLSSFSLWSHANLRYPAALERVLRTLLVTPEVHRAHHSVFREEHDRNYGSVLLVWDRLFGSYLAHPGEGHERMRIGLRAWRGQGEQRLAALLLQPLKAEPAIIHAPPRRPETPAE